MLCPMQHINTYDYFTRASHMVDVRFWICRITCVSYRISIVSIINALNHQKYWHFDYQSYWYLTKCTRRKRGKKKGKTTCRNNELTLIAVWGVFMPNLFAWMRIGPNASGTDRFRVRVEHVKLHVIWVRKRTGRRVCVCIRMYIICLMTSKLSSACLSGVQEKEWAWYKKQHPDSMMKWTHNYIV